MQLFYCDNISEHSAIFSREESAHCIRVLKMRKGDQVSFTDGNGLICTGIIEGDDPAAVRVRVTGRTEGDDHRRYRLHIAISPLKNDDRLEWFTEKAVELGIDEITPLICTRSTREKIRRNRLEALILSAVKQSVKSFLPRLNDPVMIGDFVKSSGPAVKLIATCDESIVRVPVTETSLRASDIVIMIGPEGDFTPEEIEEARKQGFIPVHFGSSRLRTETAGVAACCSVYLANI